MALSVTHTLQTAIADDPSFDVSSSEWNAAHSMTGTLPVANGGTNATDAATALTNLGAVAKAGDTMSGVLKLPNGTQALPALSFTSESSSGFYRNGAGVVSVSVLNSEVMSWNATLKQTIAYGSISLTPATGSADFQLMPQAASQSAKITFYQTSDPKWIVAKGTSDEFYIMDVASLGYLMTAPSNGTTVQFNKSVLLAADPTALLGAATKQYVDGKADKATNITAGNGLTGGGDLSINRAFAVGQGAGITINSDDVALTTPVAVTHGGTGIITYAIGDLLYASGAGALSKLADVATGNALISGGVNVAPAWGKVGLTTHVSGTLAVGSGGTNITTYAIGDLLYASAAGVLSKLADVATGNALISGGAGVAPSYGKIGLTTHISGTLPVANGGTNATTAAAALTSLGAVAKAGDTMSGSLTLNAAQNLYLAGHVTPQMAWVPSSGATVNGQIYQSGDVLSFAAAGVGVKATLNLVSGILAITGTPAAAGDVATKGYVDGLTTAATAAEFVANSAPTEHLTPGAVWTAAAPVALTESASAVTPNLSSGIDFTWTLGGAGRIINNPSNLKPGQKGVIILTVGAAGTITTWGTAYKFAGGAKPTLTLSGIDIISYVAQGTSGAPIMYCTHSAGFA